VCVCYISVLNPLTPVSRRGASINIPIRFVVTCYRPPLRSEYIYTYKNIYIYIYIYMCVYIYIIYRYVVLLLAVLLPCDQSRKAAVGVGLLLRMSASSA